MPGDRNPTQPFRASELLARTVAMAPGMPSLRGELRDYGGDPTVRRWFETDLDEDRLVELERVPQELRTAMTDLADRLWSHPLNPARTE